MPTVSRDGGPRLRGRRSECETLDHVVAGIRTGVSQVVVLRGEAGVGKSALLDYLAATASQCRVLRTAGVESEMELPFAGLHQFCVPMLDRLEHLPAPQGDALATAFGLRSGESADRFFIGLATLTLLSDVADEQPVLCVVDDAQWLDRASAQALAFVARRLSAEAVALVFAEREPSRELAGLPELVVAGLADDDARAVLESVVTGPLDGRVRDRIVAETHGNPLALIELPHGLTHAELAGGFGLATGSPLSGHIEASFRRRLEPTSSGHPGAVARRRRRAGRRPADRVARRRAAGCRRTCAGPGVARPASSSSASACDSVTRSCDRPSTGRRR